MSRSGYIDDDGDGQWSLIRWRGAVASALRGQRGQAFLREMLAALDALPEPRLIAEDIVTADGACCAIGAVALARGTNVTDLDPEESEIVAERFGIAEAMAREIVYENDECADGETPEERFTRMRAWVARQILVREDELSPADE